MVKTVRPIIRSLITAILKSNKFAHCLCSWMSNRDGLIISKLSALLGLIDKCNSGY